MPKLTIDGHEIEVAPGTSVLQAAEALGIEIPRFCYHDRLSVPANCRMCLVEQEKAPKPVASCALAAADGMVIKTDTPLVHKARKGVMEFLLINHPLDCPICDQGGECDLQDQAVAYGFDRGRFSENKRSVVDKYMGPLIKTIMTRCIHCTRCVRFADEIAGVPELGLLGRGENVEIGTYVEAAIRSELSGNLVDVCPVGAITSRPYAFAARPWELRRVESIDPFDALGSNTTLHVRSGEVLRALPRLNEAINEEWLADKSRHAVDGLTKRRLDRPYIRNADGKLEPASWEAAFAKIARHLKDLPGDRVAAMTGDLVDAEATLALRDLLRALGSPHLECRQDGALFDPAHRAGWLFNSSLAGIDMADVLLLIGTDPRREAPLLNARIRKRWRSGQLLVGSIGAPIDATFKYRRLGSGPAALDGFAATEFGRRLAAAARPMVILGTGPTLGPQGRAVHGAVRRLCDEVGVVRPDWNGFNFLHLAAGRVGALELGFVPQGAGFDREAILGGCESGQIAALWAFGADDLPVARLGRTFLIYQGHHGDRLAARADVILPGAAWAEKNATYVNTEGRAQRARLAVFPPGDAREDWKILRMASQVLGRPLPYDSLGELRRHLERASPVFAAIDQIVPASWAPFGGEGAIAAARFATPLDGYYQTDPISRASPTMAACVAELATPLTLEERRTGTHG